MDLLALLDRILQLAESPLGMADILAAVADHVSRPVDCAVVRDALLSCPNAAEIETDLWIEASKIVDGRSFFAIPERGDLAVGRVCFVGSDLFFLMRQAVLRKEAVFVPASGAEIAVTTSFEDTGYFYVHGLDAWYAAEGFVAESDSILVTVLDYRAGRYAIKRLPERELDEYVSRQTRESVCNWLALLARREPERFPGRIDKSFSISGALRLILAEHGNLFTGYPCNLSFFMSLDERFFVSGNQFALRSSMESEDFTEHYMGNDAGMLFEPQDIGKFNRALEALFEVGDPGQAQDLFVQLARDYPHEKLLHKYIYQAAWQLDNLEAVRRHAAIYRQAYDKDPDVYCTLAEVALIDGQYEEAKRLLDDAGARVHRDDIGMRADIAVVRMRVFWENDEDEQAIAAARELLELEADNEEALGLLAEFAPPAGEKGTMVTGQGLVIQGDFGDRKTKTGDKDE